MIVLSMVSKPRCKICFDNEKTSVIDIKSYNGKFDQGIGDIVANNTVIGVFVDNGYIYILLNNRVIDITNKKINCINMSQGELQKFTILVDDKEIFSTLYKPNYTIHDLLAGEEIEDLDFLVRLGNILGSKESIEQFRTGHFSRQK